MSTELVIFNAIWYITESLDRKNSLAGLYFDFSRAFDIVNYSRLVIKGGIVELGVWLICLLGHICRRDFNTLLS